MEGLGPKAEGEKCRLTWTGKGSGSSDRLDDITCHHTIQHLLKVQTWVSL